MDFQSAKSFRKLRLGAFQPYHQILYMSTLLTLGISISNAFNAIYVDTVDTVSHLIVLCIRCCVRATNTSVDSVNKHSIKCIACFDLHVDSVNKQDTLLNTQ